ncbi:UDP-2,4-diacetamido-2,4,6-trideoxy-beta-L-altropyranose hydrolase [Bradyrhizobium sp. CCBAU 53380]|uniref:UDP-2,4-diacetamido-2,4, 6-trideoxy-beta-L-altropyranose hydrolase n=1 Tax=Bradyrhizobium sp. CCBAU 53380 TaxID=1325117 RepID=UPI0023045087|nr:UDP-2,4-diacetamido-2,4,6-trideoxy-beta-L-altropyranose hydrolase [Bradyrhizobium sp. CCBAU 53380]MDA9421477.1 hypothetical protein [Bradyrhizobium sp. CCBAU 53380]
MNRQVVFRVDASVEMGLGHLTRCLTLADALAADGARSCFLMRSHVAGLAYLAESRGHQVRLLADPAARSAETGDRGGPHAHWLPTDWREDADQTRRALDEIDAAEWLVVDHYALDARWEQACRRNGMRILAVDDLADRDHDCEILLDQNLVHGMETRYRGRVPATCAQLLGPRYALLRPEFAAQRALLTPRSGQINRILVCFGGSDPSNETAKALEAIGSLSMPQLAVDVVIGLTNPNAASVEALCGRSASTELHRGANNVAELMRLADLSIGAGGVMSWERCCLGLPTIAMHIAANQVGALAALAAVGALDYLGDSRGVTVDQITASLAAFTADPARARAMAEVATGLVGGTGTDQVVAKMRPPRSV